MPTRNRDPKTGRYLDKLTDPTRAEILEALSSGVPPAVAAAYAGVAERTYQNWMSQGRAAIANANGDLAKVLETNQHAQFALEVEETLARFVVGNNAIITDAGRRKNEGEWQALAWQLERRFPQWFSRKTRHEITGADGGPIQHAVTVAIPQQAWERLSIDDRLQLAEILGKVEGHVIEQNPAGEMLALNP